MQKTTWASTSMRLAEDGSKRLLSARDENQELRQHLLELLKRVRLEEDQPERLQESLLNIEQYLRGVLAEL